MLDSKSCAESRTQSCKCVQMSVSAILPVILIDMTLSGVESHILFDTAGRNISTAANASVVGMYIEVSCSDMQILNETQVSEDDGVDFPLDVSPIDCPAARELPVHEGNELILDKTTRYDRRQVDRRADRGAPAEARQRIMARQDRSESRPIREQLQRIKGQ